MARPGGAHADDATLWRLEHDFAVSLLVEAGAGSGKTRSLARRMAAGIAAGAYDIRRMAAVTFTRKAAAELRSRFQMELEDLLSDTAAADVRARVEGALAEIERLFAGTIHAFCAHLLRERPVEARVAPGFIEIDEVEDARERRRAWREFVSRELASGSSTLQDLKDAGIRPGDLDGAFASVCQNEDVTFPQGDAAMPDVEAGWQAFDAFWSQLSALMPDVNPDERCKALQLAREFGSRYAFGRRYRRRPATLAGFMDDWDSVKVTMTWWGANGRTARTLVETFQAERAVPFVRGWRAYTYRLAVELVSRGREFFAAERRRQNLVNYVDLLSVTARLLRENLDVRRELHEKYRHLFIDEFQDTDPIQAEVFALLAAKPEEAGTDWRRVAIQPGALFVVGDPKQSIYRFRRADIDVYTMVRDRILACGGEVLRLRRNWRSLPGVCALANEVFPKLFPAEATRESPAFESLVPVREDQDAPSGPRIARLVVPAEVERRDVAAWEADQIARFIRQEVDAGRRTWGSFLILTRNRPRLRLYADALDRLQIPAEVSGAGRFAGSPQVVALADLLACLADPLDGPALVGVLRGPLFGLSDPELFAFRRAGGRFDLATPLPGVEDPVTALVQGSPEAAVFEAISTLQGWRRLAYRLPLGAAVDVMLEQSGWLALAATAPGGGQAGALVQAVDYVRQVAEGGGGLSQAADALRADEEVASDVEVLPLEPGRTNVVRLMNLHKAKGLEADVVFLADPTHGWPFGVDLRIDREADTPTGHLLLQRKFEGQFGHVELGRPADWDGHEAIEEKYQEAEKYRLLYVAATRARDLLVVGQYAAVKRNGGTWNEAWGELDACLARHAVLPALDAPAPATARPEVDLSAHAQARAAAERAAAHARAREATWQVGSVTGDRAGEDATFARRVREAVEGPGTPGDSPGPLAVETPGDRADAGVAWGSLMHGLLEHAVRHASATRADLERLSRWLTVEHTELRPFIPEALDLVDEIVRTGTLRDALASGHTHVEVPFAVRIDGEPPAGAGSLSATGDRAIGPVVLRGVIDLVYRAADGWRILDYKTDRIDGMTDIGRWLLARHGPQLDQYRAAWQAATGDAVTGTGIVSLRAKETYWERCT